MCNFPPQLDSLNCRSRKYGNCWTWLLHLTAAECLYPPLWWMQYSTTAASDLLINFLSVPPGHWVAWRSKGGKTKHGGYGNTVSAETFYNLNHHLLCPFPTIPSLSSICYE